MKRGAWVVVIGLVGFVLWGLSDRVNAQNKPWLVKKTISLADVAPAKTLVYISLNNLAVNKDKLKDTVMYRMYEYFIKKETLAKFKELFSGRGMRRSIDDEAVEKENADMPDIDKELQKSLGVTLQELISLFNGEVAFALTSLQKAKDADEPEVDFLIKIDVSNPAKVKEIIRKAMNVEDLERLPSYKTSEPAITVYKPQVDEAKGICFAIYENSLIAGFSKDGLESALKGLAEGTGKDGNLTTSPGYQKFARQAKPEEAAMVFYLNTSALLKSPLVKELEEKSPIQVKAMLETFGLDVVKSLGSSTTIKNGRFYEVTYIYAPGDKEELLKAIALPRLTDADGITLTSESDTGSMGFSGPSGVVIIAAIAIPNLMSAKVKAKDEMANAQLSMIEAALAGYEADKGNLPTTEEGLKILAEKAEQFGPYLEKAPLDPWGHPFQYRCPGTHNNEYDLWSLGPDGIDKTKDDIKNWQQ